MSQALRVNELDKEGEGAVWKGLPQGGGRGSTGTAKGPVRGGFGMLGWALCAKEFNLFGRSHRKPLRVLQW